MYKFKLRRIFQNNFNPLRITFMIFFNFFSSHQTLFMCVYTNKHTIHTIVHGLAKGRHLYLISSVNHILPRAHIYTINNNNDDDNLTKHINNSDIASNKRRKNIHWYHCKKMRWEDIRMKFFFLYTYHKLFKCA